MEKNYNYNYENRSQGQKLPIGYSNLGVSSCTSKVLDKSPVTNGNLWHTTDTNEFYYDWNGSRIKLNLTGDNASIVAELNKIKEEIKNLDPDAVKDIVNELKGQVDIAVSNANDAAKAAQKAAEQVKNKADVSYVNNAIAGKADASVVTTLQNTVSDLETSISNKANASDVTALSQVISNKVDKSDLNSKADVADVEKLQTELGNKADKTDLDVLKGAVDAIQIPTKVSEFENDAKYITRLDIKDDLLTSEDRAALDAIKDLGASDVETGKFPVVDLAAPTDPTKADLDGLATVQDVMDYVNKLIEKKKGELSPVEPGIPYLYTNGYRVGDAAIKLTDPLNKYEIVLNENNEFEIELLHKNEEDGYYVEGDPDNSYLGVYFKVIIPSAYDIKLYMWDPNTNDYKATDTSTADPAYELVPDVETPETTVYYYRSAVEGCFIAGCNAVENFVNAYGHLIKAVITKK